MPSLSGPQHRAMEAAAHGISTLGIPKKVGEEFSKADKGKTFDQASLAPNAAIVAGMLRMPRNAAADAEFSESDHPRAPDGKFADGSSASPMSLAEAKKNYEKDVVPKGWFTHGRSTVDAGKKDVLQTGNPIFMTKSNDIADQYAKKGSVHYLAPGVETDVHDLVDDPDGFAKIEKAFKRDFDRGTLPSEFDEVLERDGISDDPDAAWEAVKADFDPEDLVQSGGWYDTNVVSWLSDNFPAAFFNLTGGAVALSPDTLQRHQVRDGEHQAHDQALAPNAAIAAGAIRFAKKPAADTSVPGMLRMLGGKDAAKKIAAGTIFQAPDGSVLLLKRGGIEGKDNFVGHWALPGGGAEPGETADQCARREAIEEMGSHEAMDADGDRKVLAETDTPNGMRFTTFLHKVFQKFEPKLNSEHTEWTWAKPGAPPSPLHPQVAKLLEGLTDEDRQATDSAFTIAMDRDSTNRFVDNDGHLHVAQSKISKAVVSPYRGGEIPGYEALGLDPNEVYQLLRPPEELEKSAASFNGKPLLKEHRPVNAEKHPQELVIGAISNPVYEHPFLKAELVIWTADDIRKVENKSKCEISCGYRYVVVMEPGVFEGVPFQGKMTQLDGNHVSIVVDGRVPGAVVGDNALA